MISLGIIGSRGYPYVYSGYETFVKELVERLPLDQFEVTVYCHRGLFKEKPDTIHGIKLVYLPSIETKIFSQLSHSLLSTIHAIWTGKKVLLYVNSANGPFGLITRLFGIKTLINVDGLEWLRPKWKGIGSKYFYFSSWLSTKLFDVVINDSEEMKKVYLREFNRDSKVMAYGANIRYSKDSSLISKWNLAAGSYYLVVGRLIPDNNCDLILNGFLQSSTSRKLVIVGDVPYEDQYAESIKDLAKSDPRVVMTGYVKSSEELAELYHGAYCYIHGHEYGGTNPTMLKAMAYGSCILALETPFNREMLTDGEFGLFFSKNFDSMRSSIEQIDNNQEEAERLEGQSRSGLGKRYDWDEVVSKYSQEIKILTIN